MKARCQNPNAADYHNYGGRGITVCRRWQKFEHFYADMGERPEGCTLDRINVDGNYEPSNCKWSTSSQQHNNRRNNRYITMLGRKQTLREWCDYYNVPYARAEARLKYGWTPERTFTTPPLIIRKQR